VNKSYIFTCNILLIIGFLHAENDKSHDINYVDVQTKYNLESREAIEKYLPERLKALISAIATNGLSVTIKHIIGDVDFDSFLFIFEADSPYRILAYSRKPTWTQKTPQELQQLLEGNCEAKKCVTQDSIMRIINITRQMTGYTGYQWKTETQENPEHFIAYSHLITIDEKNYIIGATIHSDKAYAYIIMPHRIEQVLKRIKKEGLESIAKTLNKNLGRDYFFIINQKYPYRFLAHREAWAGLTPKEATLQRDPDCDRPACDVDAVVKILRKSLKKDGGFSVYPWINKKGENPILKITYIKPFEYDKRKLFIGTGFPADISLEKAQDLQKFVQNGIKFINEVGLENAISAAKKLNKPERYLFIMEIDPPQKFILHVDPNYDQHTPTEIQAYINSLGKADVSITELCSNLAEHTKNGGGFAGFKFLINTQKPQAGVTLKVYYTELLNYQGKKYVIGTGIPIEQSYS